MSASSSAIRRRSVGKTDRGRFFFTRTICRRMSAARFDELMRAMGQFHEWKNEYQPTKDGESSGHPAVTAPRPGRKAGLLHRDSRNHSARKRAEEELRQANARLDLAVRGSNMSIWECDMPDGRIENSHLTLINAWELLGYDARTSPDGLSLDRSRSCSIRTTKHA